MIEQEAAPARSGPPLLPPFPNGWYALAFSHQLKHGQVRPLTFAGRDIVLYRTASGVAAAADAYCPHLGAHLGYGGTIHDDCIRCPFHGFRYDLRGDCALVPYGTKSPPLAKLRMLQIRESHGVILAWHDAEDRPPVWAPPSLDTRGWSALVTKEWSLRGHPQETTENSVDFGHFSQIHGYTDVAALKDAVVDGPYLNARYGMTRPKGLLGKPVRIEFEVHAWGLGYSLVEMSVPAFALQGRMFVLSTPLDGERIRLRVAFSLHGDVDGSAVPMLRFVPRPVVNQIVTRMTLRGAAQDVEQDFVIWNHKRYVQPPILAAGDGPVGRYRQWARQFYSSSDAARV